MRKNPSTEATGRGTGLEVPSPLLIYPLVTVLTKVTDALEMQRQLDAEACRASGLWMSQPCDGSNGLQLLGSNGVTETAPSEIRLEPSKISLSESQRYAVTSVTTCIRVTQPGPVKPRALPAHAPRPSTGEKL